MKSTEHASDASTPYHLPVLLNETLDALVINPSGIYVDATLGGGGHSRGILQRLNKQGKLFAFDQDADAAANVPNDERFVFLPYNFRHLKRILRLQGVAHVDGVMADLGVSSHQFDTAERGFSIRMDGPLDMRMDRRQVLTAATIVKTYDEKQLHRIFEQYGEVTNSKTLARLITHQRNHCTTDSIEQFKAMIHSAVKGNPNKYLAQVFQALRMEVNDETGALKDLLQQIPEVLKSGGRAAIITFHSIEDRIVKHFFRQGKMEESLHNPLLPEREEKVFDLVNKKPIQAQPAELAANPRSRSARLRVAQKR
jgi:16S rRNA (cytosine1402-N4)-methyltransferase